MQVRFAQTRSLDIAIKATVVLIVVALAFLGYTMYVTAQAEKAGTPAARAAANLEKVVRENPNDIAARLRYADALAAAGEYRKALEQYQAALEIRPDDPQALTGLGVLAMNQGEWRTAEGYWRKIIEVLEESQYAAVDQRLEKAYYYLGSTLMELKEYEDAALYLREALRIRRDASDTYFLLAIAYKNMDDPLKFEENLVNALQFDPLLPEANYEYGLLLLEKGDSASAAERFRISADNAPPDRPEPAAELEKFGVAEDRLAAAETALAAGDDAAALTEARIAFALDQDSEPALRMIAKLWEKSGKADEARAAWQKLLEIVPADAEAEDALQRIPAPVQ